jgi:ankyrin repeat protein
LLAQGAPLDICTAAMLGRRDDVARFLREDASNIHKRGAHHIPLLAHAALSGDAGLVEMLYIGGATEGTAFALNVAVESNDVGLASWLLANASPDLAWQNWRGKTALEVATDNGNVAVVELLKKHGAES